MMNKQKVYLSGGMKSGWQKRIISEINNENIYYYDPSNKKNIEQLGLYSYVNWDLHYIKQCDIIFAYVESDNPSCIGLSVEIGYAKGLGKNVVLVLEKNKHVNNKYLSFLEGCADLVLKDINEAVLYFKDIQ